jgi:cytochrome b involved in lipid metabolism
MEKCEGAMRQARRFFSDKFSVVLHAGKDADEMFEDIGHSSEARTKMKEYLIGTLQVAHLNHALSRSC